MKARSVPLATVARYVSIGTGLLMMLLGALALIFGSFAVGGVVLAESFVVLPVEIFALPVFLVELPPSAQHAFRVPHNLLQTYKIRAGLYVVFSIACWFSKTTIAAGVFIVVAAGIYAVADLYKGEKGPLIEPASKKSPLAMGDVLSSNAKEEANSGL